MLVAVVAACDGDGDGNTVAAVAIVAVAVAVAVRPRVTLPCLHCVSAGASGDLVTATLYQCPCCK